MSEFEFSLIYKLPDSEIDPEIYVSQLHEAGCDDALIGIGQPGRIGLDFIREADSAKQAILTAMGDVRNAIPEAIFIEATPDLVGMTDIAEIMGVTRQNIQKLVTKHIKTFPAPVHSGRAAFWRLSTVLEWYEQVLGQTAGHPLREVAITNTQVNIARDSKLWDADLRREVDDLTRYSEPA